MVLYSVVTSYHLLNAIVHKLRMEKPAVLAVAKGMEQKLENFSRVGDFFERIVLWEPEYHLSHNSYECIDYFENILGSFKDYQEVYVYGAQYALGVVMTENSIPFVYCEEAAGMLSRQSILENIVLGLNKSSEFYERAKNLNLYAGGNEVVKSIMCNTSAQLNTFKITDNIIDFDVAKEINNLENVHREALIDFFVGDLKFNNDSDNIMILTQHFCNLKMLKFEEQALVYQLFVDYFFADDKILFKCHPDDIMYYKKLFPKCQVVHEKFPSELTPYIFSKSFKRIATIFSTATHGLRGIYKNDIFELDERFLNDYKNIHKYYMCVQLAKMLHKDIVSIHANELLLKKLSYVQHLENIKIIENGTIKEIYSNSIIVIDSVNFSNPSLMPFLDSIPNDSFIVFINSKDDFCWYNYYRQDIWNKVVARKIKKCCMSVKTDTFYSDLNEEILYMYINNDEVRKVLADIEINKELKNTGINISMTPSLEEQEDILVLKGILAATERRLIYYMNKVEELELQLKERV